MQLLGRLIPHNPLKSTLIATNLRFTFRFFSSGGDDLWNDVPASSWTMELTKEHCKIDSEERTQSQTEAGPEIFNSHDKEFHVPSLPYKLDFKVMPEGWDGTARDPVEVHNEISLPLSAVDIEIQVEKLTKIINDSPYPDKPLHPVLSQQIPQNALSTSVVENVLGCLFATHANGLKASEFFRYILQAPHLRPSADAFEKTLHILTRMRYFDKAWELMEEIKKKHPSLLTIKSMNIVLSRIARFQSFEETLEAFERMEKDIYIRNKFGTEEFNVLLRAFCTQRQMKEARSVFNKLHSRFSPDTKTMNILLLGFKESGDITSVELFYHDMTRRGFKPNNITYNIRIDAYCKKGSFGNALRLFEAMEHENCLPTLQTITTLIHGAGVVRNKSKAKELFDDISHRNLQADTGAYNALISSFIRCRDVKSAAGIMNEMDEKNVSHDNVTYHTMFKGFMKSKDIDGFYGLYQKMIERNFMPKTETVVMLMKLFCENNEINLAVNLWVYLIERGYCPHSHALNLLVTALCSRGRLEEAFECSKQMLERGRHISDLAFRMLERCLQEEAGMEKLRILDHLIKRLSTVLPPSRGYATGLYQSIN